MIHEIPLTHQAEVDPATNRTFRGTMRLITTRRQLTIKLQIHRVSHVTPLIPLHCSASHKQNDNLDAMFGKTAFCEIGPGLSVRRVVARHLVYFLVTPCLAELYYIKLQPERPNRSAGALAQMDSHGTSRLRAMRKMQVTNWSLFMQENSSECKFIYHVGR